LIAVAALLLSMSAWPSRDNAAFPDVVHKKLVVRGAPNEPAPLRGTIDTGWLVSFCTPHLCAPRAVDLTLPKNGSLTIDVQAIRMNDRAPASATLLVETSGARVSGAVRLPRRANLITKQ